MYLALQVLLSIAFEEESYGMEEEVNYLLEDKWSLELDQRTTY